MSDPKNPEFFSADYDSGTATTSPVPVQSPAEPSTDLIVESSTYGTGKPYRIFIRAKITHDQS
jgi:hypothetical protein